MSAKPLQFPTSDIARPVADAIVITSETRIISKHERRRLRNAAYNQIRINSPTASKGLVKQAAFTRSKAGFAAMQALAKCNACGNTVAVASFPEHIEKFCEAIHGKQTK